MPRRTDKPDAPETVVRPEDQTKPKTLTVTNLAKGPRGVHHTRGQEMIEPGATFTGEFIPAEERGVRDKPDVFKVVDGAPEPEATDEA